MGWGSLRRHALKRGEVVERLLTTQGPPGPASRAEPRRRASPDAARQGTAGQGLLSRDWSGYCGGMGLLGDLIKSVSDVVTSGRRRGGTPSREAGRRGGRRPESTSAARSLSSSPAAAAHGNPAQERARSSRADAEDLPGESGPDATVQVDPHRIGPVRMSYSPQTDGAPDPGEVVWTWVPFEENDGRGKDRPVLVVAVESAGTYLAVQLTSKDHDSEGDFVSVGAGGWDGEHRPSSVNLDRVIRVHEGGMRREAAALPREPFERVTGRPASALRLALAPGLRCSAGRRRGPASTTAPPRATSGTPVISSARRCCQMARTYR